MDNPEIDQIIISIYADYTTYSLVVLGTNKDRNKFWICDEISNKPSIIKIKDDIDNCFNQYKIRNIVSNQVLIVEIADKFYKKLFDVNSYKREVRQKPKLVDFDIKNIAFLANCLLNDEMIIFKEKLIKRENNIIEQLKTFDIDIVNHKLFALFQGLEAFEPRKYCGFYLGTWKKS